MGQGRGSRHGKRAFRKDHDKSSHVDDNPVRTMNMRGVRQASFFMCCAGRGDAPEFGPCAWPNTRGVLGFRHGIAPNGRCALPNAQFLLEWDPLEGPMHRGLRRAYRGHGIGGRRSRGQQGRRWNSVDVGFVARKAKRLTTVRPPKPHCREKSMHRRRVGSSTEASAVEGL